MNATERAALAELTLTISRYLVPIRPRTDRAAYATTGEYLEAHRKHQQIHDELQRTRAIHVAGDLRWIGKCTDSADALIRMHQINRCYTEALAEPLPYPVAPDARPLFDEAAGVPA
jgi:hypothetical protein